MSRITSERVREWASMILVDMGPFCRESLSKLADQMDADDKRMKALEAERDLLWLLVVKWRQEGANIDAFHATMGTGYHVCADELDAALTETAPTGEPR